MDKAADKRADIAALTYEEFATFSTLHRWGNVRSEPPPPHNASLTYSTLALKPLPGLLTRLHMSNVSSSLRGRNRIAPENIVLPWETVLCFQEPSQRVQPSPQ